MASEASASVTPTVSSSGNIEVFTWLKTLPVAPEYHPTLVEFQDPIAYIFKIEKEASKYGICKIVPPVPPPPKKTAILNLNKSLLARSTGSAPTFTTRQQQIGFCPRKHRPVQKPVWQSGENYTVEEFEAKAKGFEKNYLKKCLKKCLSPLEIETLYWKTTVDKPFSVEYANDMPGSAFAPIKDRNNIYSNNVTLGETEWNMRGVARSKNSLLRFMKEEIPGVTSPMVYIAMMFSWFAWHVEDHDLHSLNYLHMGSGKTWYGVPGDAAVAFEEVTRVHGYAGEINPLVTFATLGEKTTVMSPEVLINAGVPCCRLVQNAGEFVVTFPRAYHSGFSHGFNCGEASNIATPDWLKVAKDAAIRRASINCPPMVSHFQLLYDLALSFCSRVPKNIRMEPRSSRLKDKKKGEGEMLVKDLFVQDVVQNNNLLHVLVGGSSVLILPRSSLGSSSSLNVKAGSKLQPQTRWFSNLGSPDLMMETAKSLVSEDAISDKKQGVQRDRGTYPLKGKFAATRVDKSLLSSGKGEDVLASISQLRSLENEDRATRCDRLSEHGLFSCVTCGVLCFACVAIVQPTDAAAHYLMTADSSIFKDWNETCDALNSATIEGNENIHESVPSSGQINKRNQDGLFDVLVQSADQIQSMGDECGEPYSNTVAQRNTSSLGLLALTYGNSSDSEEDEVQADIKIGVGKIEPVDCLRESRLHFENDGSASEAVAHCHDISHKEITCEDGIPLQMVWPCVEPRVTRDRSESEYDQALDQSSEYRRSSFASTDNGLLDNTWHQMKLQHFASNCSSAVNHPVETTMTTAMPMVSFENTPASLSTRPDEDSSRMHVFCLQHAVQVEKQLRSVGGAHVFLLCHPDYPEVEAQAKRVAEELGSDYAWNDLPYREVSKEEEETIKVALESEEAIHGNGDWAVKLGINLYYSANLSRSPLYSKQMPYNSIIYDAFGRSPPNPPRKIAFSGNGSGKQKKMVVAGKWCGRVWMSNQVHPFLTGRGHEEEQDKSITTRVKPDVKPETPSESTLTAERASRTFNNTGRKRNSRVEIRSLIKAKLLEAEEQAKALEDSSLNCSLQQCKSNLRNKQMKRETPEPCTKFLRNSKQLNSDIQFEPATHKKSAGIQRNKKRSNSGTEEEPGIRNKRARNKKPSHCDAEDEPETLIKNARNKKQSQINADELESHSNQTRNKKWLDNEDEPEGGPSTRLRKRSLKPSKDKLARSVEAKIVAKKQRDDGKAKKGSIGSSHAKARDKKAQFPCDIEGCTMSFSSKQELALHKRNVCPVKGCGKKFFSHKYLVQHRRVHMDDRPLKCPWKGCKMTFKWAWARTEHIRVHTGARPYVCAEAGCGQTFRFVSDFSRHKRKTGHSSKKSRVTNP